MPSRWDRLVGLRGDRDRLGGDARALTRELDFARHEAREIEGARLHQGEDVELKATLGRIRHAAEIIESVGVATAAIDDEGGAADRLRLALDRIRYARDLDPSLEPFVVRLEAAIAEIDEVAADLRNVADGIDHDPAGLRVMEDRAAAIADLKRKYGATVDEVIAYGADAAARAAHLGALVARAETITSELETAQAAAAAAGEALAEGRRRAGKALTTEALSLLGELGFRDPVLSIDVVPATPGPARVRPGDALVRLRPPGSPPARCHGWRREASSAGSCSPFGSPPASPMPMSSPSTRSTPGSAGQRRWPWGSCSPASPQGVRCWW